MDIALAVRGVLAEMGVPVEDGGALPPLDSLMVLDVVAKLEEACDKTIPSAAIRLEAFSTVASVVAMLNELE